MSIAVERDRTPTQAPPTTGQPPLQRGVLAAGLLLGAGLALVVLVRSGGRATVLLGLGAGLGFVLFHSRFGFTSAWRQLVTVRQGAALRAHVLMLAVAVTLFAPVLALGVGGASPSPSLAPLDLGLLVGSVAFGLGMQVGGSCASGTLFAVGSGQSAIVLTLGGFVVGSVLAAASWSFWTGLPALPAVSLADSPLGYPGGWLLTLLALAAVAALTLVLGRRRGSLPPVGRAPAAHGAARAVRGSWPLWVGALLLAGLNAAVLVVSGHAWGITSAFALWGSKLLGLVGVDVTSWSYWAGSGKQASYAAGVLGDTTSLTDLGVMLGALLAAASAGAWTLHRRVPARMALGAVLGGVLMGYGARIAHGCNIGAYVDGIASQSLHGWIWGGLALLGTVIGVRLRPLFGLGNPRPGDAVC